MSSLRERLLWHFELDVGVNMVDATRCRHHELQHPPLEIVGHIGVSGQAFLKAQRTPATRCIGANTYVIGITPPLRERRLRPQAHGGSSLRLSWLCRKASEGPLALLDHPSTLEACPTCGRSRPPCNGPWAPARSQVTPPPTRSSVLRPLRMRPSFS